MFQALSDRLSEIVDKMKGWGSLTEKNIETGLRDIKLALLEADVNYKVVKEFINGATAEALGEKVLKSLTPAQQFTKVIYDHLVKVLGAEAYELSINRGVLSTLLLVGLQGSGKTTTAVKLAHYLQKNYQTKPLLVAADIHRPAAIQQLELLSQKAGLSVFKNQKELAWVVAQQAVQHAKENGYGVVVVDTAGRLELDEAMMDELVKIKDKIEPQEIFLVADAATGQAAINIAKGFDEKLGITGIILSRMDSDARGGAALSMSYVTQKHIHFIGTGEKIEDLEKFYPARIARRILNMGDVVSLVEKVQQDFDLEKAKKLEKKMRKDSFDLNDLLDQLQQLHRFGPLESILEMIPGALKESGIKIDDRELKHTEAIINSMTRVERANYKIINGSRRKRIALGSGTSVFEVNRLLKNFEQMKKMMKRLGKGGKQRFSNFASIMRNF